MRYIYRKVEKLVFHAELDDFETGRKALVLQEKPNSDGKKGYFSTYITVSEYLNQKEISHSNWSPVEEDQFIDAVRFVFDNFSCRKHFIQRPILHIFF
jgi:hypothetical protein